MPENLDPRALKIFCLPDDENAENYILNHFGTKVIQRHGTSLVLSAFLRSEGIAKNKALQKECDIKK